jgi:hypothetical protein
MTFEQRWAEFIQRNPTLASARDGSIEIKLAAMKKVAKAFFESGKQNSPPPPDKPSVVDSLFGSIFGN